MSSEAQPTLPPAGAPLAAQGRARASASGHEGSDAVVYAFVAREASRLRRSRGLALAADGALFAGALGLMLALASALNTALGTPLAAPSNAWPWVLMALLLLPLVLGLLRTLRSPRQALILSRAGQRLGDPAALLAWRATRETSSRASAEASRPERHPRLKAALQAHAARLVKEQLRREHASVGGPDTGSVTYPATDSASAGQRRAEAKAQLRARVRRLAPLALFLGAGAYALVASAEAASSPTTPLGPASPEARLQAPSSRDTASPPRSRAADEGSPQRRAEAAEASLAKLRSEREPENTGDRVRPETPPSAQAHPTPKIAPPATSDAETTTPEAAARRREALREELRQALASQDEARLRQALQAIADTPTASGSERNSLQERAKLALAQGPGQEGRKGLGGPAAELLRDWPQDSEAIALQSTPQDAGTQASSSTRGKITPLQDAATTGPGVSRSPTPTALRGARTARERAILAAYFRD